MAQKDGQQKSGLRHYQLNRIIFWSFKAHRHLLHERLSLKEQQSRWRCPKEIMWTVQTTANFELMAIDF